jgi:hypothetical protein
VYRKFREEQLRLADRATEYPKLPTEEELDAKVDAMIAAGPKRLNDSRVDTVKAKSAAMLLSEQASNPKLPAVATKQTAASASRRQPLQSALPSRTRPLRSTRPAPVNVSKNTIGFPKAKAAPSIIPKSSRPVQTKTNAKPPAKKISQDDIHPKDFVRLYGQPPVESKMWERLLRHDLLEEELKREEEADGQNALFDDVDDLLRGDLANEVDVFQLEMPQ